MSMEYPCVYFEKDRKCRKFSDDTVISYCVMGPCPEQKLSNADRIRDMSDEELSEFISRIEIGDFGQQVYGKTFCDMCKGQYECDDCRLWWLQQPAEEGT